MHSPTLNDLPSPLKVKSGWPWTEESLRLVDSISDGRPEIKISIVTPSYNQGQFIEQTIRSVLLQGYTNLEYIIIDGGSTDNSVEIIKKYESWLTYWVSEPDRGQGHAINKGFNKCTGEIMAWLNSDDYLLPNTLSKVVGSYKKYPSVGGWFGGGKRVDGKGNVIFIRYPNKLSASDIMNWLDNWVVQPACFFSRKAWGKSGPLNESLNYAIDFELWFKIAKEFEIIKIEELLAVANEHEKMKTIAFRPEMFIEAWFLQINNGYEECAKESMRKALWDLYSVKKKVNKLLSFPALRVIYKTLRPLIKALLC